MLRLIEQLESSSYGKVIKTKVGRESYYELDKSFIKAPFMKFSAEGLGNLAICRDLCRHWLPRAAWKKLEAALTQVTALTENQAAVYARQVGQARFKGQIDYDIFQTQFETMVEAIRQEKICRLQYRPGGESKTSQYYYAPLELFAYQETLYFMGWVLDPTDFQPYHPNPMVICLHRLESVETLDRSSKNMPRLAENSWDSFGLYCEDLFRVEALFSQDVATWVSERIWSRDQVLSWREDGQLLLAFTASSSVEILSWALSFGCNVEVLAPDWLRKEMSEEIQRLAQRYKIGI
jgi:predicted DNA-binding transcriptional regulator YafY